MKQYLFLIALLFVMPVFADQERLVISLPSCVYAAVNVTASDRIDPSEYNLPGCSGNTTGNEWTCNCSADGLNLSLLTNDYTVNEYNFTITYFYDGSEKTVHVSSGGGGGHTWLNTTAPVTKVNKTVVSSSNVSSNGTVQVLNETRNFNIVIAVPPESAVQAVQQKRSQGTIWLVLAIIWFVLTIITAMAVLKYRKAP